MAFFSKLGNILSRGKAKRNLLELYEDIYLISSYLVRDIEQLLRMKNETLSHPWIYRGEKAKGIIGLRKGEFVQESLLPKLKYFEKVFLEKSREAKGLSQDLIVPELEKLELERTLKLLEDTRSKIPSENDIRKLEGLGDREKTEEIANITRNITLIAREFKLEEEKERLTRVVLAKEVSPLVMRVFNQATESNKFTSRVIKKEFKALVREADLESYHNPKWRVHWRGWWRRAPKIEVDATTGITEPHANVTMTINGEKKDIHLVIRN